MVGMSVRQADIVIRHATPDPGVDCMIAAEFLSLFGRFGAASDRMGFIRLNNGGEPFSRRDEAQHAAAFGTLLPNGFIWPERALAKAVSPESHVSLSEFRTPEWPAIFSYNPLAMPGVCDNDLRGLLGAEATWIDVREADGQLIALTDDGLECGRWRRDEYGRAVGQILAERLPTSFSGLNWPRPARSGHCCVNSEKNGEDPVRLLVIDERAHQFDTYPALILAIGDAADCLGTKVELNFAAPHQTPAHLWPELMMNSDAILMPGGGGTHQIQGQILAAMAALDSGTPVLGICVGLQAMAVAVARKRCGMPDADHQEDNPETNIPVVARVLDTLGAPEHRIGDRLLGIVEGSKVAAEYRNIIALERVHHSYRVSATYAPSLARGGFKPTMFDPNREMIDAMELDGHPCFIGIQGHPEFSSSPGMPHPLLVGLLAHGRKRPV